MKLFRKRRKARRKLERIGIVYIKEMKSNRKLRRKLEGTRLDSVIKQIIRE